MVERKLVNDTCSTYCQCSSRSKAERSRSVRQFVFAFFHQMKPRTTWTSSLNLRREPLVMVRNDLEALRRLKGTM